MLNQIIIFTEEQLRDFMKQYYNNENLHLSNVKNGFFFLARYPIFNK